MCKGNNRFNFCQQMAVLQNQWGPNGKKKNCGQTARMISMRKICALCDKANVRNYDLRKVIPGSAEKRKNSAKMETRSPKQKNKKKLKILPMGT